ncbi:DNA repair protein rad16 [Elasticomyces elasticus]|nr:DNA repair protein rad16 [Elasticomyces elasticus]
MAKGDTKGATISGDTARYNTRTKPPYVAGYVGLQNTQKLKELYLCPAWKEIVDPFEKLKTEQGLSLKKIHDVFIALRNNSATEKYGDKNADRRRWKVNDHTAHAIQQVISAENKLLGDPKFGPFEGEKDVEPWNRAYSLLENYHWLMSRSAKNASTFWKDSYVHKSAVIPPFMSRRTNVIPTPADPRLFQHDFECKWMNRATLLAAFPVHEREISGIPEPVHVIDPRVTEERQFRDYLRREMRLKDLVQGQPLDLDTLTFVGPNPDPNMPDRIINAVADWEAVQEFCKSARRPVDLEGYYFKLWTKQVAVNADIYESHITPGMQDIYVLDDQGLLSRANVRPAALAPTMDEEAAAEEEDLLAVEAAPDPEFFPPESADIDGFDPYNDTDNVRRRTFQRDACSRLSKGLTLPNRHSVRVTPAERAVHVQAVRLSDIIDTDPEHTLAGEVDGRLETLSQERGGEIYVGPDYGVSCTHFNLDVTNPKPRGAPFVLKKQQVTCMKWCFDQENGPIKGGVIGDEMGMGKTDEILAYINEHAYNQVSEPNRPGVVHRPSIILSPPSCLYQWADAIKRWSQLRLYIYYESSSPKDKYAIYRIHPRDLAGYKGNGSTDNIRDDLRYLFDHSDPQASRAVILSSLPSFRDRAGIAVEDEDKKSVYYSNQFGKDEGHLAKNPATKLSKVIRLLEPICFWILTGTPMPNEAIDYAGLMKVLWRNEWLHGLNPAEMKLWESSNLKYDDPAAEDRIRRFQMHPSNITVARGDSQLLAERVRGAMALTLLRRCRGSKIPNGPNNIEVGGTLPNVYIITVSLRHGIHRDAELQLHHRYYAQEFERALKNCIQRDGDRVIFRYPTAIYRQLCLLSDSLALEAASYKLSTEDIQLSTANILRWAKLEEPLDYRFWAKAFRRPIDPVMTKKMDFLRLLADSSPKIKWLCTWFHDDIVCAKKPQKCILYYQWVPFGQLIVDFFKALGFRIAHITSDMGQLERHEIYTRFNNKDDTSIELLFLSYRCSSLGLNVQGDCSRMVLLEPAIARNTELQAIGRIYRDGQEETCYVFRLYLVNSMDKYREHKSTQKFVAEIAVHSEGEECQRKLKELMRKDSPDEDFDLDDAQQLEKACKLLTAHLFNLEATSSEDGDEINLDYQLLKRNYAGFLTT